MTKIWEIAFEVAMDRKQPDSWSKIDTYSVVADSIEEAVEKCRNKAIEVWDKRPVRIYKAELSIEVDVP